MTVGVRLHVILGSSFNNSITFLYRFGSSKKKAVLVLMAIIVIASSKIVIGVSFRYSGGISFLAPQLNNRKNGFNPDGIKDGDRFHCGGQADDADSTPVK